MSKIIVSVINEMVLFVVISLENEFSHCEEELPKKPVGRQSADSQPTVGNVLVTCR